MLDYATIFTLFSCNEWKEYSSMRFISASTNIGDIHKKIKSEIRQGNMDYNGSTKRAGVKAFVSDIENNRVELGLLEYGHVVESENLAVIKKGNKLKACI